MKYNMPHQREKDMDKGSGSSTNAYKLYKPLPNKSGAVGKNEIFVSLFNPALWGLFNPTPEQVVKYGIVGSSSQNISLRAIPSDLFTFYFKLPVHNVSEYHRPDGTVGFAHLICPIKLNEYLVKVLGFGSLFENPKCAHCEKEQEWWTVFNNRWDELGYGEEVKKGLSKDEYNRVVDSDKILTNSRKVARNYKASERYIVSVFDHDKFTGKRKLDEDNPTLEYQLWLAPKTIFEKLTNIYEINQDNVNQGIDVPFFDTTSPQGLHIITVTKNTTKCSDNDFRNTKYDATHGKRCVYPKEWLDYLNNMSAMVDPSEFIFLANYEDMKHELEGESPEKSSDEQPPIENRSTSANFPRPNMLSEGLSPKASIPMPPGMTPPDQQVQAPQPPIPQVPVTTDSNPQPPISPIATPPAPHSGIPIPPTPSQTGSPIPPMPSIPQTQTGVSSIPNQVSPDRTPPANSVSPVKKINW